MPRSNEFGLEFVDDIDRWCVLRVVVDSIALNQVGSQMHHHRCLFLARVVTAIFPHRIQHVSVRTVQRADQKCEDPVSCRQVPLDCSNHIGVAAVAIHKNKPPHPFGFAHVDQILQQLHESRHLHPARKGKRTEVVVQAHALGRKTEDASSQLVGAHGSAVARCLDLKTVRSIGQRGAVRLRRAYRKNADVRLERTDVGDGHFFENALAHLFDSGEGEGDQDSLGDWNVSRWLNLTPMGGLSKLAFSNPHIQKDLTAMGNTFGHLFRLTTWGESHGGGVGAVVDGCPPGLTLSPDDIQAELDRRRPGQSRITTQRQEDDRVEILSGVFEGLTLGTPISLLVWNKDARSQDYEEIRVKYRPSHADFTYQEKYGIRNWKGGGRASARETIGRVAAGAIAQKILKERCGIEIVAWVARVQTIEADVNSATVSRAEVDANIARCPDAATAEKMIARIDEARKDGDSLGGIVQAVARNVPVGLGDPVFDKLEADLAKAMLSLPACKGFESGSGFAGTELTGSTHNDAFIQRDGKIATSTNRSGGIQGGISNGQDILIRAAFKPTATILKEQDTVDVDGNPTTLKGRGRHDPCVLPRAVPMVEAMMALVLVDHYLRQSAMTP